MIKIAELNKADVLAALYNRARAQGMGFLQYDPTPMTREQAQEILDAGHTRFDYIKGRVMKVSLSGDEFDPWGFDRDNGQGAAQEALDALAATGDPNAEVIQAGHRKSIAEAQRFQY